MAKMKKNEKDLRVEIVKTLEGKRKFRFCWEETTNCSIELEAANEEEAREKFLSGNYDMEDIDYWDTAWVDGSLEVEEVDKGRNTGGITPSV